MKRIICLLFAVFAILGTFACAKKPLGEDEVDKIVGDLNLGEDVNLDEYDDAQKEQIKDKLDEGGFVVDEDGTLRPKDPVSDEKLEEIVKDAVDKGEVNLGGYDDAQKEQIKDKLEQEGLTPDPEGGEEDGVVDVVPIPALTEAQITEYLEGIGIFEGQTLQDDFKVKADLSGYTKSQKEQIVAAAGLLGAELVTENGVEYFKAMSIHIDYVEDNPNE